MKGKTFKGRAMRDEEKIQRQKDFLISIAFWGVWIVIAFLFLKAAGSVLLPFVIAFLVAWILAKPVDYIAGKTNLKRNIVAVLVVLIFYVLVGAVVCFAGSRLVRLMYDTFYEVSYFFSDTVIPVLQRFFLWLEKFLGAFSPAVPEGSGQIAGAAAENASPEVMEKAGNVVSEISGDMISRISGMAAGIPGILMNILIAVIATVFMEMEFHGILFFLKKQVPQKYRKMFKDGKEYVTGTLGRCFLSYCLILGITFLELCVGLCILKVDGAVVIAFIIAVLDILPVLGTGTVLLPWAVVAFASGSISMGVGVLILYLVITVVRNIIEPKLVGHQMGLSPVVMLPCMLVGLKFFGMIGLFLVPLGVAFLKSLNDRGVIHIFHA